MPPLCSGPNPFLKIAGRLNLKNFDYCICFLLNLCYGVYIPVEEAAEFAATETGSGLRHWPPGTNSSAFVPPFFAPKSPFFRFALNFLFLIGAQTEQAGPATGWAI
jgi:hypothetical protein